jgi:hypothetical protein
MYFSKWQVNKCNVKKKKPMDNTAKVVFNGYLNQSIITVKK